MCDYSSPSPNGGSDHGGGLSHSLSGVDFQFTNILSVEIEYQQLVTGSISSVAQ